MAQPVHDLRAEYAHLPWWQGPPPHCPRLEWQSRILYARLPDFGFETTYQAICEFNTAEECAAAMHAHNSMLTRKAPSQYREALRLACEALTLEDWSEQRRVALINGIQVLQMWPAPL